MTATIDFTLNGKKVAAAVPANRVLADFLRDDWKLTGSKVGCDQAVCGACTVLVDGAPVAACSTFVFEVESAEVVTIEGLPDAGGLASGETLTPVQRGFLEASGFQCGYCTPGMIMLATALLKRHPDPDEKTVREWMSANICRCTGYNAILEAVQRAAAIARAPSER